MMQSQILNQNRVKNLKEVAHDVGIMYASTLPGEPFHPDYLKNKESFRLLLKTATTFEKQLKVYFSHLSSKIDTGVDWSVYHQKVMGSVYTTDVFWENERIALQTEFTDTIDGAFDAGAMMGEQDMNLMISYSSKDASAIEAIRKYTGSMAKDITDTTHEKVKQSILESLKLQETQQQAVSRLQQVIDDPIRASKIAHTEAVRAYTLGKIEVGREVGATFMMWRDGQAGACATCSSLHMQVIPFDQLFLGKFMGPPAHPWCKCNLKVIAPSQLNIVTGDDKGHWITTRSGKHINLDWNKQGAKLRPNYKHVNDMVVHETTDSLRVHQYERLIAKGHEVAPLLLVKEGSKWGVEDGKHRLQAFMNLGHKLVPAVTKEEISSTAMKEAYSNALDRDQKAIEKLPYPNRITIDSK